VLYLLVGYKVFHVQLEDGHYQAPKHVVVPYVENNLYSTNKYSCVRRVHTLYISFWLECYDYVKHKILKCILLVISTVFDLINAQKTENINTLSGHSRPILGLISFAFALHSTVLYCTVLYCTVHSGPVGKMQVSLTSKQMVRLAQSDEHTRPHRSANPSSFQEFLL